MTDLRVDPDHDPRGLERGRALALTVDGVVVPAFDGETIGGALLAAGVRTLRATRFDGRPRGLFCGIGACFDCLVHVADAGGDGPAPLGPVRACVTRVTDGMAVTTHGPASASADDPAAEGRS